MENNANYMAKTSALNESTQHIVQDTSVLKVLDFHIGVQSNLDLKILTRASCYFDIFVHLKIARSQVDAKCLFAGQTCVKR